MGAGQGAERRRIRYLTPVADANIPVGAQGPVRKEECMTLSSIVRPLAAGLVALAFVAPAPAMAATACKEVKTKTACTARGDCAWVKGYTTKKGKKIDAYCRAKGAKKKTEPAKPAKKKS